MAAKKKRETHLAPIGSSAPPTEVPWCKGFDLHGLWNKAVDRRAKKVPHHVPVLVSQPGSEGDIDYDRSDIVDEAMRLAYLAGARDGALESARGTRWVLEFITSADPPKEHRPDALSSMDEWWRNMFNEAKTMGEHCIRAARHAARVAKKGGV